jgi:hypothetical protein
MTRTRTADAAMSACARAASGRRIPGPATTPMACLPQVGPVRRASHRPAVRSRRRGLARPPLLPQCAWAPGPSCPRQPVHVHPLYLYLLRWHAATPYEWSFDPGRDILCILI